MDAASANGIVLGMAALLLLGVIGYGVFVESRRMLHDDGRLRFRRMLVRNGVRPATVANEYYETARATRRCVACAERRVHLAPRARLAAAPPAAQCTSCF
jgi:hypothetical protein